MCEDTESFLSWDFTAWVQSVSVTPPQIPEFSTPCHPAQILESFYDSGPTEDREFEQWVHSLGVSPIWLPNLDPPSSNATPVRTEDNTSIQNVQNSDFTELNSLNSAPFLNTDEYPSPTHSSYSLIFPIPILQPPSFPSLMATPFSAQSKSGKAIPELQPDFSAGNEITAIKTVVLSTSATKVNSSREKRHQCFVRRDIQPFSWDFITDPIRRAKIVRWKKKRDRIRAGFTTRHVYDVRIRHAVSRAREGYVKFSKCSLRAFVI